MNHGESTLTNHSIAGSAQVERELESIQAAYTMGAMTISGAMSETGNAGGTAGQTYEENRISVAFAF